MHVHSEIAERKLNRAALMSRRRSFQAFVTQRMTNTRCLTFWAIADSLGSSALLARMVLSPLLLPQLLVRHVVHVTEAAVESLAAALLLEAVESTRDTSTGIMQLTADRPLPSMRLKRRVLDLCSSI